LLNKLSGYSFESLINKLFGKEEKDLLVKSKLERSASFLLEFEKWEESNSYQLEINAIYQHFKGDANERELFRLKDRAADGFYFLINPDENKQDYCFFLDAMKNRMKALDYILNRAVKIQKEKKDEVYQTEQYYLKPSLKYRYDLPYEQLYGNLFLEYVIKNNRPFYFKIQVNYFNDRNYKKSLPFDEFLTKLVGDE